MSAPRIVHQDGAVTLWLGDCLEALRGVPDASLDCCVTDPPYGLGTREPTVDNLIAYLRDGADLDHGGDFMGKKWSMPSVAVWREIHRVLRPGAHVLCFAGTRTWDVMSLGLRAAGFENRDTIGRGVPALAWASGSGFPKALDVSKGLDRAAGMTREVVGPSAAQCVYVLRGEPCRGHGDADQCQSGATIHAARTAPATDAAARWDGWATAMKPAWEVILVFRKPLDGVPCDELRRVSGLDHWCRRQTIIAKKPRFAEFVAQGFAPIIGEVGPDGDDEEAIEEAPTKPAVKPHFLLWTKKALHAEAETLTVLVHAAGETIIARAPFKAWHVAGVPANVLAHGTGGLNIDGCRVGTDGGGTRCDRRDGDGNCLGHDNAGRSTSGATVHARENRGRDGEPSADRCYTDESGTDFAATPGPRGGDARGRWPANVVLSHADGCERVGTKRVAANQSNSPGSGAGPNGWFAGGVVKPSTADADGLETVDAYQCVDGCPVAELDRQSGSLTSGAWNGQLGGGLGESRGTTHGERSPVPQFRDADTGGASRFFYVAKADRAEREEGCAHLPARRGAEAVDREEGSAGLTPRAGAGRTAGKVRNHHPTVKPVELMRWLVRLVTPRGGVVLDPFMGSGSTGVACSREGFRFVGIERDESYMKIAVARIQGDMPLFRRGRP